MAGYRGERVIGQITGTVTANPGTGTFNVQDVPYSSIVSSSITVTTAATRVQFSATTVPCKYIAVTNPITNTGVLYVGGSSVSSTVGTEILPGSQRIFPIDNLTDLWADASVSASLVKFDYYV